MKQRLGFLRGISRSFSRHGSDDRNVPHIAHGYAGGRLCLGRRPGAAPVRIDYGTLFSAPPGANGGRGELFIQLDKTRLMFRASHPSQQNIVHTLKVAGFGRPASVAPDDFARETVNSKDLVDHDLDVMAGSAIDVNHKAAVGRKQWVKGFYASAKAVQVRWEVNPSVIEGGFALAKGRFSGLQLTDDAVVFAQRKKGRIHINE